MNKVDYILFGPVNTQTQKKYIYYSSRIDETSTYMIEIFRCIEDQGNKGE